MVQNNSKFIETNYQSDQQKRREARLNVDLPCEVTYQKSRIEGNIIELGVGGVKFQSNSPFYEGDEVGIEFLIENQKITLRGKIIRVSGKNLVAQTGDLGEDINIKIQNFIYNYYNGSSPKTKTNSRMQARS